VSGRRRADRNREDDPAARPAHCDDAGFAGVAPARVRAALTSRSGGTRTDAPKTCAAGPDGAGVTALPDGGAVSGPVKDGKRTASGRQPDGKRAPE
jgi:hypothetical protein